MPPAAMKSLRVALGAGLLVAMAAAAAEAPDAPPREAREVAPRGAPRALQRLARRGFAPAIWLENATHTLGALADWGRDAGEMFRPTPVPEAPPPRADPAPEQARVGAAPPP